MNRIATADRRWDEAVPPSILLLSWHGRVGRSQWWLFGAALPLAIGVIGAALMQIAGHGPQSPWRSLLQLSAMLPLLAVTLGVVAVRVWRGKRGGEG